MKIEYKCLKYERKYLCPPMNDNLDCKDCIYSSLIINP